MKLLFFLFSNQFMNGMGSNSSQDETSSENEEIQEARLRLIEQILSFDTPPPSPDNQREVCQIPTPPLSPDSKREVDQI